MGVRRVEGPARRGERGRALCDGSLLLLLAVTLALCFAGPVSAAGGARDPYLAPQSGARAALQQGVLTAADPKLGDSLGYAVAIAGDTAVAGAWGHTIGAMRQAGAACVFTRSGGVWTRQALLTAGDPGEMTPSACRSPSPETRSSSARLLMPSAAWSAAPPTSSRVPAASGRARPSCIAPARAAGDYFGDSVAVSGTTILVGAPSREVSGKAGAGAVYVFSYSAGSWTLQDTLTLGPVAFTDDELGISVALWGETALVGSPGDDEPGQGGCGAAYTFSRATGVWEPGTRLIAADGATDDDSAPRWPSAALRRSSAHLGTTPAAWRGRAPPTSSLTPVVAGSSRPSRSPRTVEPGAAFGVSVGLSGSTALVGAPGRLAGGREGAAYVFMPSDGTWTQQGEPLVPASVIGPFGVSVAVSGSTALGGAPGQTVSGVPSAGAAYAFLVTPRVTGFLPASGPAGASVTITGAGFTGATSVRFNGVPATFVVDSDETITATVPAGPASGLVSVSTPGGLASSGLRFTVIPGPVVASFLPARGLVGTPVTLTGTGFTGATAVAFAGTAATFVVDSDLQITTSVPAAATSGPITVTTPGGVGATAASFTVVPPLIVTGFSPASGVVGTPVTITGSGFMWAAAVTFNGTAAAFTVEGGNIFTAVPAGATSGLIVVASEDMAAFGATDFIVVPAPAVTGLRPASGKRRATVTINGAGFGATRSGSVVKFGSKACGTYLSWSDTRIKCKVPAKAKYGRVGVRVRTAGGVSNAKNFRVKR